MKKYLDEWLKGRPKIIKDLANKLNPFLRYRIKSTGQHCDIYSYSEDGTVTVAVNGYDKEILNIMNQSIQVNVFGLSPDDIEELKQSNNSKGN